jgi:hypothetical protein
MNMLSLPVAILTDWNRRRAWDARLKGKRMVDPVSLVNAACAWMNGNPQHALEEGFAVESAVVNDTSIVVTFQPAGNSGASFRASFELRAIETIDFAHLRRTREQA